MIREEQRDKLISYLRLNKIEDKSRIIKDVGIETTIDEVMDDLPIQYNVRIEAPESYMKEGTEIKVYIDGMLSGTATDTVTASTSNTESLRFGIGDGASPLPLNGLIDEVRVYNVALCDTDVVAIMGQP